MRAVWVRQHGAPETACVEEVPSPVIGDDQVLVDVKAVGVNYPDLLVIGGTYQILPPRPFSPGKDAAGIVRAVGRNATHCKPGDRVAVHLEYGAYAEQVAAKDAACHVIPDAMSFEEAAAMGLVYQTAHFALIERGLYQRGETVLVNGAAGGVGLAAVQIAKGLGATVLAGVNCATHAAIARENGADHVIDLAQPDLRDSLRGQVHALNGGRGADVVLDPLGGAVFEASLRALAWRGRMVVIGFAAGAIPELKVNYLLLKNISVSGLQWSDYRERRPEWVRRVQTELFGLYAIGAIRPRIMRAFPLERFAEALALVKGGGVQGKVVLTTARSAD
ncbi:MAG: NADPH:quinone oxidoreductase family protein [Burkholderiales bacterium]